MMKTITVPDGLTDAALAELVHAGDAAFEKQLAELAEEIFEEK